jgi:hypothetical protein
MNDPDQITNSREDLISNRNEVFLNDDLFESSSPTTIQLSKMRNKFKDNFLITILFTINLVNYMDRFTVAGM